MLEITAAEKPSLDEVWPAFMCAVDRPLKALLNDAKPVLSEDSSLKIQVSNKFIIDLLRKGEKYRSVVTLLRTLFENDSLSVSYELTAVTPSPARTAVVENSEPKLLENQVEPAKVAVPSLPRNADNGQKTLQRELSFDTFVQSDNNNLAAATAMNVAQAPGKTFNPLFIYGGVGLGKTHLMNAIGNYILDHNQDTTVMYVSAERFCNEYIESLAARKMPSFREKFRGVDVLLIDDIHFIINKDRVQEEIFQTFEELRSSGRQIVISSDRPPKLMPTVIDRLRNRFEWGMIADIQPPSLETRVAILKRKAETYKIKLNDDILNYMAEEFYSNVRELEGALIRVINYCHICHKPLVLENVKLALSELLHSETTNKTDVETVKKVVCEYFGITEEDLVSTRRDQKLVRPRHLAMYLCKAMVEGASYPEIGESFGGRDHTTVMHAYKKVEEKLNEVFYKTSLANLKARLK